MAENVRLIVTLCEEFELESIYSKEEFEELGVRNLRYAVPDAVGAPEIAELEDILWNIITMERKGYCKNYILTVQCIVYHTIH